MENNKAAPQGCAGFARSALRALPPCCACRAQPSVPPAPPPSVGRGKAASRRFGGSAGSSGLDFALSCSANISSSESFRRGYFPICSGHFPSGILQPTVVKSHHSICHFCHQPRVAIPAPRNDNFFIIENENGGIPRKRFSANGICHFFAIALFCYRQQFCQTKKDIDYFIREQFYRMMPRTNFKLSCKGRTRKR